MCAPEAVIRQVNRLYHELTQGSFDAQHRYRHRVEGAFWRSAAALAIARVRRQETGTGSATSSSAPRCLKVVEVGCGTGFLTTIVGERLGPGDTLIAVDVSEAALKSTGCKWNRRVVSGGPRLDRVAADAQRLPLAAGSVDLLVMNAVLHHLPSPEATLAEIDRVLRPGGLFGLGFEPNRAHFECELMRALCRALDRVCWYASPRQNRRRLSEWWGVGAVPAMATAAPDCAWAGPINARLLEDGLIGSPLSSREILDMVDPHTRGAGAEAGFDPVGLIERAFPGDEVLLLEFTDYLGESIRRMPRLRVAADRLLAAMVPRRGTLFSWLLRKPAAVVRAGRNGRQKAAAEAVGVA